MSIMAARAILGVSVICRLCRRQSSATHALAIFVPTSLMINLPKRISDLLDVPVDENDNRPWKICQKCKRRVESLERAAQELASFRI